MYVINVVSDFHQNNEKKKEKEREAAKLKLFCRGLPKPRTDMVKGILKIF